jgi:DNA-binding Lrp family transcriptional regulator
MAVSSLYLSAAPPRETPLIYPGQPATTTFPEEPLDSRDRQLIQAIGGEGGKGIGFNKLVERTKPFASRATVAVRAERLVRLGYLERIGVARGRGKERPIRLTFKCFSLISCVDKTKEIAAGLRSKIQAMERTETLGEEELRRWWGEFRERYNALFGLVGMMAVFYGTSAAGDLFLPLIVDDYKTLGMGFLTLVRARPALVTSLAGIIDEASITGIDLEEIRKKTRDEAVGPAIYRFRGWDD